MFLSNLKFEQKEVFLGLAKKILLIDGEIDNSEADYLRSICAEMSLSQNDEKEISITVLKDIYKSEEERRLVLVELIALAYSNGEYHKQEKEFIDNIISEFGMQPTSIETVENLVNQFFIVQKSIVRYISQKEDK